VGFNLQLTAFSEKPDIEGLREAGLKERWRIFGAPDESAWLMDFHYGQKDAGPAFWDSAAFLATEKLPAVSELPELDRETGELLAELAHGAWLLSAAAKAPCLTCMSNDELIDVVAIAQGGEIVEMAAIHQQSEQIDETRYHDRVLSKHFKDGRAHSDILTHLIVVDDGKRMFVDEEVVQNYHINALSDRMLEAFLGQRITAFDDNYVAPENWDWPLIAVHPDKPKGGLFRRLFGR